MGLLRRAPLASETTPAAPHVRDALDLAGVMRAGVVALLPCVFFGAHAIGRQAFLALADVGATRAAGWRGDLLEALGLSSAPDDVLAATVQGLLHLAPMFGVALLANVFWERLFARVRRRDVVPGAALQALVFALLVPATLPLGQAAVAMSFGAVIGKEVFGGTGRNLVHPAVLAWAFLLLAWPASMRGWAVWVPVEGVERPTLFDRVARDGPGILAAEGIGLLDVLRGGHPGPAAAASPLAALAGGLYLLARRLIAWRTVVAVALGVLATAWGFQLTRPVSAPLLDLAPHWHLVLGSLAFGAIFLATDPITAPVTHAGRWIHGFLLGGVVVLVRVANPTHPEGTVLALLLGSVFAPLNDAVVVTWHKVRRARRA